MRKLIVAVAIPVLLTLSGCINIPDRHSVMSQRGNINAVHTVNGCDPDRLVEHRASTSEQAAKLDAGGFSLLVWNVLKGTRSDGTSDFLRFCSEKDLLIIQEAYLTEEFRSMLQKKHYNWDMSIAFEYRNIKAGVLTASKIEPSFVCTFQKKEPLIRIPKTILITMYPLSGGDQFLLVANLHLINYTMSVSQFSAQVRQMERILSKHPGPLIVNGDFNTWSDKRMAVIDASAGHLNLKAVTFKDNNRSLVLGHNVDHIYYRGLEPLEAISTAVTTSDHNPLQIKFRLPAR
ncbi:MAG: endonuclease/exonuclease/phosphatase family protein [Desulfobacteraceae bacterium]|nr:endonuclease/exonuclease/phosphatase family protein [Desulfobacteraceae bacterium]